MIEPCFVQELTQDGRNQLDVRDPLVGEQAYQLMRVLRRLVRNNADRASRKEGRAELPDSHVKGGRRRLSHDGVALQVQQMDLGVQMVHHAHLRDDRALRHARAAGGEQAVARCIERILDTLAQIQMRRLCGSRCRAVLIGQNDDRVGEHPDMRATRIRPEWVDRDVDRADRVAGQDIDEALHAARALRHDEPSERT